MPFHVEASLKKKPLKLSQDIAQVPYTPIVHLYFPLFVVASCFIVTSFVLDRVLIFIFG